MMELISLNTILKVYREYNNDGSYSYGIDKPSTDVKELVDYCESVKSYLHSVNSNDIDFYKEMLSHDNFLDRMTTLLYMVDNIPDFVKFKSMLIDSVDYKFVRAIGHAIGVYNSNKPYTKLDTLQEVYNEVFKKEILAKKREDLLNQIL